MTVLPSPNFGPRRDGVLPSLIVLHYTAMASHAEARARLCAPDAEVSAHWLISEAGDAEPLVDEAMRAWHAGQGAWGLICDVNSHSIGIELVNSGATPFAARQMAVLERLLADIMARWTIRPEAVIAHSDLAPLRKSDPGRRFDWRRLALAGLSVWPDPAAVPGATDFLSHARRFGYPDAGEAAVLQAFRLRFRPWATGPLDATDAALAADLARRFAIDADRGAA